MPKDKISDYSASAVDNDNIGGVDLREGAMTKDKVNDALRELMSHLADLNSGASPIHDTFVMSDPADDTKRFRFDVGGISAGQMRVWRVPDQDVTITGFAAGLFDNADAASMRTTLGLAIGTDVQAYDANALKSDTSDNLEAGFTATAHNYGTRTSGTLTLDDTKASLQRVINGGTWTLAVPSIGATLGVTVVLKITNNANAGSVTLPANADGDDLDTVNGNIFWAFVTGIAGNWLVTVKADPGNS